ncbi:MAG: hypothetical protein HYV28_09995 [Ignavibacteriales bacterium]|nr:hypothetical protein [Ignavibacteriales bacterium]
MKLLKSFVSILFLTAVIFPQSEDVEIDNRVYNFVERMHVQGFVQSYNSFSLPVSRRMIADKLQEISLKKEQLSVNDNKLLQQFTVEFENELTDTLIQTAGIFNKGDYRFGNTNRYLYYSKEKSKGSLFVSMYGSVDYYQNENNSLSALNIGGIVRGTLADHFGYYVYGSNGKISGSKSMTRYSSVLRNSYKLAEKAEETFFDDTRGYVTFESGDIKVKYGRDYQLLGSGCI